MKKKILLRTLIPLTTMGVGLGVALPLVSCSCGNNDQPIVSGFLIDGSNWQGWKAGKLTFDRDQGNHTVSYIGCSADYEAVDLVIPNTVCDVDGTFYAVTTIGATAFRNCGGLIGVLTIDNSVTTINDNAFYGCYRLTSLKIGNNIATIGDKAFYGCSGLIDDSGTIVRDKISQSGDNIYYIDNGTVAYCLGMYKNIMSNGTDPSGPIVLLSNTKVVGDLAFHDRTTLHDTLTIPTGVTNIGYCAFYYCHFTGSLTIPSTVITIDSSAFNGCNFTGSLTIPDSVTSIGSNAFTLCSELDGDLIIGNKVTTINLSTFKQCTNLTSITFGNSVTTIRTSAFQQCSNITSITGNFNNQPTIDTGVFNSFNNTTGGTVHNNSSWYSSQQLRDYLVNNCGLPAIWQIV